MSESYVPSRLTFLLETAVHLLLRIFTGKQVRHESALPIPNGETGPVIYYANHSSHLDAPLIWYALPPHVRRITHPVAGKDYWDEGKIRRFVARRVFNVLMLERAKEHSCHTNRLADLVHALQQGESLILFPEGTREQDGHITGFKPGLYHLHQQVPEAMFIPVYLNNLYRVLPKGAVIPLPCQCCVHFGEPLEMPAEKEEKSRFLTRARDALTTLSRSHHVSV